jgi:formylglycine-generating enzyme required for sulfatase activity
MAKAPIKPAAKSKDVDAPAEQQFDKLDDLNNFSLLEGPDPEDVLTVVNADPEGMFVAIEIPVPTAPANAQKLPEGFAPEAATGYTEDGWPLRIVCAADEKVMACVPSGLFTQGVDRGPADAGPAHPMSLDTYYIDVTEVTIGEFTKFKTAMIGKEGAPAATVPLTGNPKHPVAKLSWKDAQNYAKWAKKDLPTEAEWEKAGRGPDGGAFPWGGERVIWDRPRQIGQVDPVGSYPHDRSRYGVLDLAGNVQEWCLDWYSDKAFAEARNKDGSPAHNWTGPKKASNGERVIKGGADRWELWARGSHGMTKPSEKVGFRCVLRLTAAK